MHCLNHVLPNTVVIFSKIRPVWEFVSSRILTLQVSYFQNPPPPPIHTRTRTLKEMSRGWWGGGEQEKNCFITFFLCSPLPQNKRDQVCYFKTPPHTHTHTHGLTNWKKCQEEGLLLQEPPPTHKHTRTLTLKEMSRRRRRTRKKYFITFLLFSPLPNNKKDWGRDWDKKKVKFFFSGSWIHFVPLPSRHFSRRFSSTPPDFHNPPWNFRINTVGLLVYNKVSLLHPVYWLVYSLY